MAYDPELLRIARREQERRVFEHKRRRAALRKQLYAAMPELQALDTHIRNVFLEALTKSAPGEIQKAAAESLSLQERRAALLDSLGAKADDLDELPLCALCRDTGRKGAAFCDCVLAHYRRMQAQNLSSVLDMKGQSFENFDSSLFSQHYDAHFGGTARENIEAVYELCRSFCSGFNEDSDNLLFSGAPGTGKTFLSACVAGAVGAQGHSVVYDTAARQLHTEEAVHFGRADADTELHSRRLRSCDLLIMDDLGAEFLTPFGQSALLDIINLRLLSRKKTIISTNLGKEELAQRYTPPLVSRLRGQFIWLDFFGDDLRRSEW